MLNQYRASKERPAPQIVDREAPMVIDATFIEPPRFSGLQQGEVLDRWYDRPAIVAPLLTFGAVLLAAGVVIAGGV